MNYIGNLNKEEKIALCMMMFSGKVCKRFFVKREQLLQRLRKGEFEVKTLSEEQALLTIVNNINEPEILKWANTLIGHYITLVNKKVSELEKNGSSYNAALAAALAMVLLDTKFSMNAELYFKLIGDIPIEPACSALYAEMTDGLARLVPETSVHIDDIKSASDKRIKELESKLTEAQAKIAELQAAAASNADAGSGHVDYADYLIQFNDTNNAALLSDNANEIISLCSIFGTVAIGIMIETEPCYNSAV